MLYQTKNPHGGDIYGENITLDYSANINPLGTPTDVLSAMHNALSQVHHYPDPYCRKLVEAIAAFHGVEKEDVLCGNGAAELIYGYCEASKPKRAVTLAPTFLEYTAALLQVGCVVDQYPLTKQNCFDLDQSFLAYLGEKKPEVIFLCNPNNPTGRMIAPTLLKEILSFCKSQNSRLFLDECFLDFVDNRKSLTDILGEYPQLFILKAFTKSYALAGVRLGYGLSADHQFLAQMAKAGQPWNVSVLAQAAGVAALGEEQFLETTKALLQQERQWLSNALEGLGFWVCPSLANYLLFQGPVHLDTSLKMMGVAIRNCENYYGLGPGWYRIAVRLHAENEKLIQAIEQIIAKE